jgi:hypothetical protein
MPPAAARPAQQATAQVYARYVALHIGATREAWRAEHQPPLALEGTLTTLADGTLLLDVGDGELRSLSDLVAEHFEVRRDALGDRFVGRVRLRVDVLATPVPPPGWVDGEEPDA